MFNTISVTKIDALVHSWGWMHSFVVCIDEMFFEHVLIWTLYNNNKMIIVHFCRIIYIAYWVNFTSFFDQYDLNEMTVSIHSFFIVKRTKTFRFFKLNHLNFTQILYVKFQGRIFCWNHTFFIKVNSFSYTKGRNISTIFIKCCLSKRNSFSQL